MKTKATKAGGEKKTAAKPGKGTPDRVPQQAEDIEHTIRRVVRNRDRYKSDKYGQYL